MTSAQLRARVRDLMAAGVLPSEPPVISRRDRMVPAELVALLESRPA